MKKTGLSLGYENWGGVPLQPEEGSGEGAVGPPQKKNEFFSLEMACFGEQRCILSVLSPRIAKRGMWCLKF